jgi:hypothetical protein
MDASQPFDAEEAEGNDAGELTSEPAAAPEVAQGVVPTATSAVEATGQPPEEPAAIQPAPPPDEPVPAVPVDHPDPGPPDR